MKLINTIEPVKCIRRDFLYTTIRESVNMARILIIDDEAQVRTMLMEYLERDGYEVMVAADGEIGMALFREEHFDIVIIDIIMPEKEGIEVIEEFRLHFPDTKMIAISGGSHNLDANNLLHTAKLLGAHCTLLKPFGREELLNAVKHLLVP